MNETTFSITQFPVTGEIVDNWIGKKIRVLNRTGEAIGELTAVYFLEIGNETRLMIQLDTGYITPWVDDTIIQLMLV